MQEPEESEPHDITLAVWDVTSPLIAGRQSTIKVGAKCSHSCDLTAARIELRNETGSSAGSGQLGSTPWPETSALYWTEVDLTAPAVEGPHVWTVMVAATHIESHQHGSTTFRFLTARPPEHRVTIAIKRSGTDAFVEDVALRLGAYQATTGQHGSATVELPGGTFEVTAWKAGYELASTTVEVAGAMTIELSLVAVPVQQEEYWM